MPSLFPTSLPRRFKALACKPADLLTPMESLITIRARQRVTINKVEPIPSLKPTEVARAVTNAEWLEGIPPVFHSRVDTISLVDFLEFFKSTIIAFRSCAKIRLVIADKKTGFSKKADKSLERKGINETIA